MNKFPPFAYLSPLILGATSAGFALLPVSSPCKRISYKNECTRWENLAGRLPLPLQSSTPSKDGLLAGAAVDSVVTRDHKSVDRAPPTVAPST